MFRSPRFTLNGWYSAAPVINFQSEAERKPLFDRGPIDPFFDIVCRDKCLQSRVFNILILDEQSDNLLYEYQKVSFNGCPLLPRQESV